MDGTSDLQCLGFEKPLSVSNKHLSRKKRENEATGHDKEGAARILKTNLINFIILKPIAPSPHMI